jgi:hypothetical protein
MKRNPDNITDIAAKAIDTLSPGIVRELAIVAFADVLASAGNALDPFDALGQMLIDAKHRRYTTRITS